MDLRLQPVERLSHLLDVGIAGPAVGGQPLVDQENLVFKLGVGQGVWIDRSLQGPGLTRQPGAAGARHANGPVAAEKGRRGAISVSFERAVRQWPRGRSAPPLLNDVGELVRQQPLSDPRTRVVLARS